MSGTAARKQEGDTKAKRIAFHEKAGN